MSVASAHRCLSLQDVLSSAYSHYEPAVLSIEELRVHLYSCFTCGVCWLQDHVCLDCSECGGYSLQRPCVQCDGGCGALWKRDITLSHASGKARWTGTCQLQNSTSPPHKSPSEEKEEEHRVCSNINQLSLGS